MQLYYNKLQYTYLSSLNNINKHNVYKIGSIVNLIYDFSTKSIKKKNCIIDQTQLHSRIHPSMTFIYRIKN